MNQDFNKFSKSKKISSLSLDNYKKRVSASYSPYVVNDSDKNMVLIDIFSQLMADRIIYLGDPIEEYSANTICAQMLYLNEISDTEPINLYLGSCGGGDIYSGNSILDTMDFIKAPVTTLSFGLTASMATVILAHGEKGSRSAMKRSRIMIHQPLTGFGYGQASDIEIHNNETQYLKRELIQQLATDSNNTYEVMANKCDRDYWMSAQQAKDFGLIDNVK